MSGYTAGQGREKTSGSGSAPLNWFAKGDHADARKKTKEKRDSICGNARER